MSSRPKPKPNVLNPIDSMATLPARTNRSAQEIFRVVEVSAHRIRQGRVLVENREIQLIGPPVLVRPGPRPLGSRGRDHWVLAFAAAVRHVGPPPLSLSPSDRSLGLTLVALDPRLCRPAGVDAKCPP